MVDFSKHKHGDVVVVHCCDKCARKAGVNPKRPADSGKASWLCDVCGHHGIGSLTDCEIGDWLRLRPLQPSRATAVCRCTLAHRVVGDGCEVCNPQLAQRLAAETQVEAVEALHGVASEHDIGYAAGWRACADEATRIVASHIDRLEPGKQLRTRDALLYLLASMRSILVSQRAAGDVR